MVKLKGGVELETVQHELNTIINAYLEEHHSHMKDGDHWKPAKEYPFWSFFWSHGKTGYKRAFDLSKNFQTASDVSILIQRVLKATNESGWPGAGSLLVDRLLKKLFEQAVEISLDEKENYLAEERLCDNPMPLDRRMSYYFLSVVLNQRKEEVELSSRNPL